jgi:DNA replication protein DnaC
MLRNRAGSVAGAYLPVVHGGGNPFFQLVNARYERGAMILTSNRGFAEWGEVFGEPRAS